MGERHEGAGGLHGWHGAGVSEGYATGVAYAPHGAPAGLVPGNGLVETMDYNARQQPDWMALGHGSVASNDQSVFYETYGYGSSNNGNVLQTGLKMPGGGATVNTAFGYDRLNRLRAAMEDGGVYRRWLRFARGRIRGDDARISDTTSGGTGGRHHRQFLTLIGAMTTSAAECRPYPRISTPVCAQTEQAANGATLPGGAKLTGVQIFMFGPNMNANALAGFPGNGPLPTIVGRSSVQSVTVVTSNGTVTVQNGRIAVKGNKTGSDGSCQ